MAAASIVAKVHRDGLMQAFDATYPAYGFARHVGYATREHLRALAEYGPTPLASALVCTRAPPPRRVFVERMSLDDRARFPSLAPPL